MITSYDFYFCHVEIYNDYLKVIMKEGVTVSPEYNDVLLQIVELHFKNKAFVYVTHRINSYAINPTIYLETVKIKNLVGFTVVSDNPRQKMQTKVEKIFFEKEFQQFDTMEAALEWKDMIIKKYGN